MFTAVAAGGVHTLALRNDGRVFGWGLNSNGEVGDGSTTQRLAPVLVPSLTGIVTIAAGATHSLALRSNGTVAAFGANDEGQLGDNSTTRRTTPITVSGLTNVVAIAAGGQHSLALKADGTVWAWGANQSGQIGDNTTTRRRVPVRVTTLAVAKAIAAGAQHSVALTQSGTVFGWGGNSSGAVGDGTTTMRRVPVPVAGLTNIATLSAGAAHTTAVGATGVHWAWGANLGALGDGTTVQRLSPVPVTPPAGATLIAAGGAHSLALTTNGTVWSTGVNLLGPLGNGSTTSTTVYGPISGPALAWGVVAPVLTPSGGTFNLPQSVTATTITPGAAIHYTINGTDPTTGDPSVTSGGLIGVDQITLLKAKAFRTGMTASPVTSGTYTLQVAAPTIAPGTGTYAAPQAVTLATASPGAALYYTLDGSDPTAASTPYVAPVVVGASATLKVLGIRTGWLDSAVASATYSFNFGTLNTPVSTPAGGTYQTPQTVALTADAGATIRYTVDGADPTEASSAYAGPLTIGATTTLKARAFRVDYTPSAILTESYVIDTTGGGDPIPPDPSTVAPPLSQTEVTPFDQQVSFLYSGANPIQRNVDVDALESFRISVLRGRVLQRDGQPLSGVRVTVLDRPEFGYTVSRLDGMFDMVVNGGAPLTVEYTRAGYLPAQRRVDPRWLDYEWASPVRLIQRDANVTTVDFSVTAPAQVARATVQTDAAGSRQATFIIPAGGVMARMTLPDGTVLPNLAQLSLRATEYTVGPGGPEAMPGELPTFSGYTYAAELSADEAEAAGATSLTFTPPLPFYVENFLNMPVGTPAPAGYYDDTLGAWTPTANGRVLRVLSPDASGRANLDVDGSGQPANAAALTALGITDGERQRLAEIYVPGTSVWRTPVPHFSPIDINWPVRLESPKQPQSPPASDPNDNPSRQDDDQPTCVSGSVIECENQVLGESVPVAGTPYSLSYRSSRSEGRIAKRTVKYRLSNATSAVDALEISTTIRVAGQEFTNTYSPAPNQTRTFTWNGFDAYGRRVVGAVGVRIEVTNEFEAQYAVATDDPAFGGPGGPPTGIIMRIPFSVSTQTDDVLMGVMAPLGAIGGWSLSVHHAFDPRSATLYRGDGGQRQALARGLVIDSYAGGHRARSPRTAASWSTTARA